MDSGRGSDGMNRKDGEKFITKLSGLHHYAFSSWLRIRNRWKYTFANATTHSEYVLLWTV